MRLLTWIKEKYKQRREERDDHDPWWVTLLLDLGRPAVAVLILTMCAPGEHYLAKLVGFGKLSWGMPGALTAYAGIAAVVATKRPKTAPGHRTAVAGALISILAAMAAQPLAHLYQQHVWTLTPVGRVWLTIAVSCVPAAVFGHLLHMGAAPTRKLKKTISEIPIQTIKEKRISLVKPYPAGPVGRLLSNPESILLEIKGRGIVHSPVVYFIRNGDRVKIGTTTNMVGRLRNLSLRMSDILIMMHGEFDLESSLHDRFSEQRVGKTEWFELSGELVDYIEWKSGTPLDTGRRRTPKTDRKPDKRRTDLARALDVPADSVDIRPDTSTGQSGTSRPVLSIKSGSLSADVRAYLSDHPDVVADYLSGRTSDADALLSAAIEEVRPGSAWDSVRKARDRFLDKEGRTA